MSDAGEIAPQGDTRKDLLSEQFEAVQTTDAPLVEAQPTKTDDRPRDEHGKFIPKAGEAPPVETATPLAEPVQEPAWAKPPKSWKKEYHEFWDKADPKLKEYAFQREEEMNNGVLPLKEKAQLADAVTKAAEPYMNIIRGLGTDIPSAVSGLMKADYELRSLPPQQKLQKFLGLAQYYGVDLTGADPDQLQQPQNQQFYGLQNELTTIKGELLSFKQQQEQAQQQAMLGEINKFASEHEHYEIAEPFMIDLLNKEEAASLKEAYEKVTGPGGKLHDLIQGSRQAAQIQNPVVVADKAAKAARAAAVQRPTSAPGATTPTKAQDRRSMLAEQLSNVSDRL